MNGFPRPASRRNVLASAFAGGVTLASGCVGRVASWSERGVAPSDVTATIAVTNVESFAPGLALEASVDVVRPWATPDAPPAIEITLENTAYFRRYSLVAGDGDWAVLSDRASDQLEPGLSLLGEEGTARSGEPDQAPDGCWKLTGTTVNPLRVRRVSMLGRRETRSAVFEVRGHHENAAGVCLPTGEYTFSDTYTVESDPSEPTFDWTFSLQVADGA